MLMTIVVEMVVTMLTVNNGGGTRGGHGGNREPIQNTLYVNTFSLAVNSYRRSVALLHS